MWRPVAELELELLGEAEDVARADDESEDEGLAVALDDPDALLVELGVAEFDGSADALADALAPAPGERVGCALREASAEALLEREAATVRVGLGETVADREGLRETEAVALVEPDTLGAVDGVDASSTLGVAELDALAELVGEGASVGGEGHALALDTALSEAAPEADGEAVEPAAGEGELARLTRALAERRGDIVDEGAPEFEARAESDDSAEGAEDADRVADADADDEDDAVADAEDEEEVDADAEGAGEGAPWPPADCGSASASSAASRCSSRGRRIARTRRRRRAAGPAAAPAPASIRIRRILARAARPLATRTARWRSDRRALSARGGAQVCSGVETAT